MNQPEPAPRTVSTMNTRAASVLARMRYARSRARQAGSSVPAQLVKTLLICLVWFASAPLYVHLVSTYDGYLSAQLTVQSMVIFGGIAVHLWPTLTPPWRTMGWAMIVMAVVGIAVLVCGGGHYALTVATISGYAVIVGRVNGNARRVSGLVRTWRTL